MRYYFILFFILVSCGNNKIVPHSENILKNEGKIKMDVSYDTKVKLKK